MVHQVIEDWGIENRRSVELLARQRRANDRKDPGTNDRSDAECGERERPERFLKAGFRILRLRDELVDGFTTKGLAWQNPTPLSGN